MKFEPKAYQAYCIEKIIKQNAVGLFLDMGMGKTVITLTAVEQLIYDYFQVSKVLVIAPLRPAVEVWPREIAKWDHLGSLRLELAVGTALERQRALEREYDVLVINRENVPWLVAQAGKAWPFDMVVIDELSSFKSAKSQRFRALKKVRGRIKRIVGLTGTPAPNGLLDLWPQVYLLDKGEALGSRLTGYRDRYFDPDKRNGQVVYSWKLKAGAESEIYGKLKGLCVSMKSEDFIKLPDRLSVIHEARLPKALAEKYRDFKRDMVLELGDEIVDGVSAGVLVNKLLQFTGGAVYSDDGVVLPVHEEKLKILDTLIEEANGRPVLVFYAYKHERDRIMTRYAGALDIKSPGAIEKWNTGQAPILVAHPASAGHGLNLQEGGHIAIWYGLTTSLELYQQANKRLHRMGQRETVLIHHIIMAGSIDERVLNYILQSKEENQAKLIEAVKAELKGEKLC